MGIGTIQKDAVPVRQELFILSQKLCQYRNVLLRHVEKFAGTSRISCAAHLCSDRRQCICKTLPVSRFLYIAGSVLLPLIGQDFDIQR